MFGGVLVFVVLSAMGFPGAFIAHHQSDHASVVWPVTPLPSECRVNPRPASDYESWLTLTSTPGPAIDAIRLYVEGTPADESTVNSVVSVIREKVACLNAGDLARSRSLSTLRDAVGDIRFIVGLWADAKDIADVLANETPFDQPRSSWATIYAVHDVRIMADGRIGALIDLPNPFWPRNADDTDYDLFVFAVEEGRLLLDEFLIWDECTPAATPTADPFE